jgi:hypothetical protein
MPPDTQIPSPVASTSPVPAPRAVFRSVLCGIDGSRSAAEAARQAAVLAGRRGALTLLVVTYERGMGRTTRPSSAAGTRGRSSSGPDRT